MAQQKRGLGKGLGALIPTAPPGSAATAPGMPGARGAADMTGRPAGAGSRVLDGAYFEEVPIGSVTPNPRQPRQAFDEEALDELAASIREVGLLQPVGGKAIAVALLHARHERMVSAVIEVGNLVDGAELRIRQIILRARINSVQQRGVS